MHPGLYAVEFAAFGSWGRCSFDPGFPLRPFSSWILEDEDEERFGNRPGEKNAIGTDHKRDPQGAALVVFALWHGRTGFAPMDLSLRCSFCSKPPLRQLEAGWPLDRQPRPYPLDPSPGGRGSFVPLCSAAIFGGHRKEGWRGCQESVSLLPTSFIAVL